MNIFSESFTVRIACGLLVFAFTLQISAQHILNGLRRLPQDMMRVAQFLGGGSILEGAVDEGGRVFRTGTLALPLPDGLGGMPGPAFLVIKPEAVWLHPGGDKGVCGGTVEDREYLGFTTTAVVAVGGLRLHAAAVSSDATREWTPGRNVGIELDWSRCALFAKA